MNSSARRVALVSLVVLALIAVGAAGPAAAQPTELFFSEYVEGSSNNKAVEIYNGTGSAVDLTAGGYHLLFYFNGNTTVGFTLALSGSVPAGDTWVVAPTNANATILGLADQTFGTAWFNGDDAVVLRKGGAAGAIVDVIGQIGFDPGSEWGTGLVSTADNTLRRKPGVCAGDTDGSDAFNPATEWDGFAQDTFDGLGSHSVSCTVPDAAPGVASTTPANGATDVAATTSLTVTFSEPVNVAGSWFQIVCATSGTRNVADTVVSGGPTTFTIDPTTDFAAGESCTVTVFAAQVTDQDTNDPPDTMAANYAWSFTTASPLPALSVNDVSIIEGNSGQTQLAFTVTLSAPSASPVQFDFTTADGTATTADNDYVLASGTLATIAAGDTTYPINVTINGDTTVEPDETFFVNLSSPVNAVISDGQGIGTILNDDFTPIHTIQGNGLASTYDGSVVTTTGVVTALKFNNGFFIQEPDATVDADPQTSEGLFVYTGSAPAVAVGDLVRVTGTVDEYVQSGNFGALTELVAPLTITVVSSGNPLPAPVALTTTMPSPAGSWYQLEHLEGMRVSVPGFEVAAATDGNPGGNYTTGTSFGDCYGVVPGLDRPFREPGIAFPNDPPSGTTIPPLLRFDSNPELLRMDTDGQVGATRHNLSARTVLPAFVGVLDYAFSRYSILPDVGSLPASPAEFGPAAVTAPLPSEFTVAAYNLQRFFDDVNDPAISEPVLTTAQYTARLAKASVGIRNYLRTPDVVGVVEVENLSTLQALATRISNDAIAAAQPDPLYQAYLIEGNDVGGIDVGFLVKTSLAGANPRVQVLSVTQELDGTLFVNPDASTELLNDRPPLMLRAVIHGANGGTHPV
ncbi:MAG: Ig-like domain-containing protein, partial [Thermoanaerobaculia bacterium]|nr:Ig-like domain-containing protein [Thermoanaerobaculia bacterium]